MKFNVRAFKDNPGGAYDPTPIHDFDADSETIIPVVGDYLQWDGFKSNLQGSRPPLRLCRTTLRP